jgi:hypothetical protein
MRGAGGGQGHTQQQLGQPEDAEGVKRVLREDKLVSEEVTV